VAENILIVIGNLNVGGAEQHLLRVMPKLCHEFNIKIYTTNFPGVLADNMQRQGIPVIAPKGWRWLNKIGKLGKIILAAVSLIQLIGLLIKMKPRIIHFYLPKSYILGGVAAFVTNCKCWVMSRRIIYSDQYRASWLFRIEKKLHKHLTYALACSKDIEDDLLSEGIEKNKVGIIYNGVEMYRELPTKPAARQALNLPHDIWIMTVIANLFPYKGHVDLLEALALIKNKLPTGWLLLGVGRDGGERARLENKTQDLGLSEHVRWLGFRFDTPLILAAADMGISSSHQEGFSNAVLESMAAGLPMVVTNISGNNEAIVDGVNGLIVPVAEPEALAAAILKLAFNRELGQAMSTATLLRVKTCFSLDKVIIDYQQFYRGLLKAPTSRKLVV